MSKKQLKEKIFFLLHDKKLLTKFRLPKPKDRNIIDTYIAEVNSMTIRIDVKQYSVRILNYEIGNDVAKYNLEDIYNELKTKI